MHGLEAQLRRLHFIWEIVRSISSLLILGAYYLWAGTRPSSDGVHGACLIWLLWFINPQGMILNQVPWSLDEKVRLLIHLVKNILLPIFFFFLFSRFYTFKNLRITKPVCEHQFILSCTKQFHLKKSINWCTITLFFRNNFHRSQILVQQFQGHI